MSPPTGNAIVIIVGIIFGMLVASFGAYSCGKEQGEKKLQQEAIKAGRAKWVIKNEPDGSFTTKFEWIETSEEKVA